jgi:hypothetical protein
MYDFILKEEHRLKVSKDRIPWKIFGHKRDKVRGRQRKCNEDFYQSSFHSLNIIRVLKPCRMKRKGSEKCIQNFGWNV